MIRAIKNFFAQGSLDLNRRPMQNAVLESLASTPGSAPVGFIYYNTSLGKPVIKTASGDVTVGASAQFTWLREHTVDTPPEVPYEFPHLVIPFACSGLKVSGAILSRGGASMNNPSFYRHSFIATLQVFAAAPSESVLHSEIFLYDNELEQEDLHVAYAFDTIEGAFPATSRLFLSFTANPIGGAYYQGDSSFIGDAIMHIAGVNES